MPTSKAKKVVTSSGERDMRVNTDGQPIRILPVAFQVLPEAFTVVL
jgi:diacylglycerol kinase family enzyme